MTLLTTFTLIISILSTSTSAFFIPFSSRSRVASRLAMRVGEIKAELEQRGVNFDDCFDKESLLDRLEQARKESPNKDTTGAERATDEASIRNQVKQMSIKELRTELAQKRIPRAGLIEKNDLVEALVKARLKALDFSVTGLIQPGNVADLTDSQVREEMTDASTPMFLDVYATWCGPCQMIAPQIQALAEEIPEIRFAKVDSDKYPNLSSELKVQGLPTLILFRGKEQVARIEGAMMKDQLKQWIEQNL